MTPELLAHIKAQERFVGHPYRDPVGLWTLGYGHRVPDGSHSPITEAEGETMLREDVMAAERDALRLSPGLTSEPDCRLDAITDFVFNCGASAYGASILRLAVNKKDWTAAATQMRRWVHAHDQTGKVITLQGLVKRREVCAHWLEHPDSLLPPAA